MIGKEDSRCHMNQIDFLINGQYISNSNTIANSFNNYFINVGNSLASSIEGTAYSSILKDMNTELEKVDKWLKSNKLSVNIKKLII